jgi:hypothetical protein
MFIPLRHTWVSVSRVLTQSSSASHLRKILLQLYPRFQIVGIVPGADLSFYRNEYGFGCWEQEQINLAGPLSLTPVILKRTIIVCTNLEQFVDPSSLLEDLKTWLEFAPVCVLTTADKDLDPAGSNGLAATPAAPGRWNLAELEHLLRAEEFDLQFIGWTASNNLNYDKNTILAVMTSEVMPRELRPSTPSEFRVVAFMAAYNEGGHHCSINQEVDRPGDQCARA